MLTYVLFTWDSFVSSIVTYRDSGIIIWRMMMKVQKARKPSQSALTVRTVVAGFVHVRKGAVTLKELIQSPAPMAPIRQRASRMNTQ